MRRRAEQIDETRQRITEATVRLHTTVGPGSTTIAGVAKEAGVTRLTVYRHFEDLDELFQACITHWVATNPLPDLDAWRAIPSRDERVRRALGELYAWYGQRHEELHPIYRDFEAMPESARQSTAALFDAIAAGMMSPLADAPVAEGHDVQMAVARHLVDFWTWHSLVVERGLSVEQATDAAIGMLLALDSQGIGQ